MNYLQISIICLVGLLLTGLAAVWAYQEFAVYRFAQTPDRPETSGVPEARAIQIAAKDGTPLTVWVVEPAKGLPVLISFHGNFTSIGPSFARMRPLIDQGFGIAMLAYRGSAGLPGKTTEAMLRDDVTTVYDRLDAMLGESIPANRRILHGFSLGTSPAVVLAAQRPAAGLVVEAGYDSLCRFQTRRLHGIPMCWLMWKERHDVIDLAGRITTPVLFAHGARDRAIYPDWARRLYDAMPGPKEFLTYKDGSHADLFRHGFADDLASFALTSTPKAAP